MSLARERVLVTGAGGFIGSHLCELLVARGAQVRAAVRYNSRNDWGHLADVDHATRDALDVRPLDIADPFAVAEAVKDCAVVFHLAALIGIPYSYVAPASYLEVNVRGTLNVLEAARRWKVRRVVHTSTSEVYGTARYTPIDEAHPLQGQSPYSASKIAADQLAESYHRSFGLPVSILRPFNAYGPRQSARAVIPTIIAQVVQGASEIRLGSLEPVRDFTYVTDTARAFVAVAESEKTIGVVCNAGHGKSISMGELARKLLGLMKAEAKVESDAGRVRPEHSEVFELRANNERIQSLTSWRPEIGLEDGLGRAIEYVRAHPERFRASEYTI
ncbi:MAG TPA: GDP-mannose 4,6-dehydratase [Candidatus Limnocylindria bacterium]|nr:GDP-mannose 4,6-dehydratase [Candidatus Limnocylindria bacterium]